MHIWSLTPERIMLSAHIVVAEGVGSVVIQELQEMLQHEYQIKHVTLQLEHQHEIRHSTEMFSLDIG